MIILLISIFSFFLLFKLDFIIYIDVTRIAASNAATDIHKQIRSRIEYLIQTYSIIFFLVYSKLRNVAALAVFNTI